MLTLLIVLIVLAAVAGGLAVHPLLWLLLAVALVVFLFGRPGRVP